jgi:hypothetical protein
MTGTQQLLGIDRANAPIIPEPRYFSMPSAKVGAEVLRNWALTVDTGAVVEPVAGGGDPLPIAAACPTTVTRSQHHAP